MSERVLVVVPTYNERENVIPPLIRELLALGAGIDVWVADDGSPDGTAGGGARGRCAENPGRVDLLLARAKRAAAAPP